MAQVLVRLWLAVPVVFTVLFATTAHAQSEPSQQRIQPWMAGSPAFDIAYVAAGIGLFVSASYLLDPAQGDTAPLDGVGHRSHRRAADTVSDIAVFGGLPLVLGLAYVADASSSDHDGHNGWVGALRVAIVLMESWIVTNAIAALIKNAGVCRPYAWNDTTRTCLSETTELGDSDWTHTAFLSGHSANVASAAGALLGLWLLSENSNMGVGVLAIGASVLSLGVAILRVWAGAHSIVDVSAGLGLGLGVGFATAALHIKPGASQSASMQSPLSLSIAF